MIGGNDGDSVLSSFECYDLERVKVIWLPEMKNKRDEVAAVKGQDGHLYAIGGYGSSERYLFKSKEKVKLLI